MSFMRQAPTYLKIGGAALRAIAQDVGDLEISRLAVGRIFFLVAFFSTKACKPLMLMHRATSGFGARVIVDRERLFLDDS